MFIKRIIIELGPENEPVEIKPVKPGTVEITVQDHPNDESVGLNLDYELAKELCEVPFATGETDDPELKNYSKKDIRLIAAILKRLAGN